MHLVSFSGGLCSFFTARRVVEWFGQGETELIFADTRIEDPDLYRFLDETVAYLGCKFTRLDQGKTPWDIFKQERFIGNSRVDPCSKLLKREAIRRYITKNHDPEDTVLHFGFDMEEECRFQKCAKLWTPYECRAVLQERPYVFRQTMLRDLPATGIELPRLYTLGFTHNNCGGFCIKAGHKQFKLLLEHFPERFAWHRDKEEEMRQMLNRDVSILKDRKGGTTKPYTLARFEQDVNGGKAIEVDEWEGCNNCFSPDEE